MFSSPGFPTSTMRRLGSLFWFGANSWLLQSMNACGTRMVLSREEKPITFPLNCSFLPPA
ncbi:Uncharacterised protein [Segatella copri]|nr:Uncharacterised protein [Segatella copri]